MEAFDGPALVGQAELLGHRTGIELPGEVPRRLAVISRKWALADEPTDWSGRIAVRPVDAHSAGPPLAALLLRSEDGDRGPLLLGHRCRQLLRGVQRRHLGGMRMGAGRPARACGVADAVPSCRMRPGRRVAGTGRAASVTSAGTRSPNVLLTWTTYGSWRPSRPARNVGTSP